MKIGFIGVGNMGQALIYGLLSSAFESRDIVVFDTNTEKLDDLRKLEFCVAGSENEVEQKSDIIIFAVKPNVLDSVLSAMTGYKDKIYLSIAAGVTINHLEEILGNDKKIVRAMPNTPAQVGCGMTVITPNKNLTPFEASTVSLMLKSVGDVLEMPEKFMSVATALHGSSPAYVYMLIDAMAEAGVKYGLTKKQSLALAAKAVEGSAKMVIETGIDPEQLKINVCSPGGTTIEAVNDLENNSFDSIIESAIRACVNKAEIMSK